MKKIKTICLFAILFVGCASGGAIKYNNSTDFSKYKTYAWENRLPDPDEDESDFIFGYDAQQLKAVISQRLRFRGFQEVTSEFGSTSGPDFLVVIETLVSRRTETIHHHEEGAKRVEGSLSLSFVDAKTKEVIWKTWAIGVIYEPDNQTNEVAQPIKEILEALEQFPPSKKG